MTDSKEPLAKKAPGGPRNKGIPRPDPNMAKPGYHLWAQLACRIYDDLYNHGVAEDRLGSNQLALKAKVSQSLVSGFFNGRKSISWEVCRALVVALGGDPAVWEPRWNETEERYRLGPPQVHRRSVRRHRKLVRHRLSWEPVHRWPVGTEL